MCRTLLPVLVASNHSCWLPSRREREHQRSGVNVRWVQNKQMFNRTVRIEVRVSANKHHSAVAISPLSQPHCVGCHVAGTLKTTSVGNGKSGGDSTMQRTCIRSFTSGCRTGFRSMRTVYHTLCVCVKRCVCGFVCYVAQGRLQAV